ncbi:phage tail tape measure protein [Pasteurella sp. 19428wF3_WM03]|uniref:phage tail tape measure protein n=1 Tax=Pasteurella sp. 19428wF3_WM03 TaxID=2782473 RepID=UPI0014320647|nr:phage tail tape measure protein [Pasteurella sp. 19428wF3_WM03]
MSSKLAIGLVIGASVKGAISGIKDVTNAFKSLKDSSLSVEQKTSSMFNLAKGSFKTAATTLTGLGSSIMALSQPAIDFESAMADVKKVVDFKTPEGFKNLSKDILDLTRTLPMTAEELAAITASGGQLGVAEEDLKDFTTTIAKMSVAFDMSAEQSGDSMAKLANVYKIPIKDIGNLGDAINELSNSSPAKASDIVNTLGRIAGVSKDFGLTENAAAALANTFISLGKSPEVASTAINGMLTSLNTADKGGKKFQAALKEVGISAKQLKQNIAKDGQGAIVDFLKRVEKLPKAKRTGVLVDLFGKEYADDVSSIAGNVDLLEKSISTLQETDESGNLKYLGSMEKEFAARSATTENSLKLLKNSFTEVGITLGSSLLPIINGFVQGMMPMVHWVSDWIGNNQELVSTLFKIGVGVATGFSGLSLVIGVFSSLAGIFLKAKTGAGLLSKTFTSFKPLFSSFSSGFINIVKAVLLSTLPAFDKLVTVLGIVKTAIVTVGRAFLTNPIGIAITVIAGLAYLLWDNWDWVSEKFSQMWQWIGEKAASCGQFIADIWNNVSGWFSSIWDNITGFFNSGIGNITASILNWSPLGLFYQIFAGVLSWFGIDLPSKFSDFGKNMIDGLVNGIKNAWEGAKQIVSDLGEGIKGWFKEKLGIHSPSRVFKGYGDNIATGLAIGIADNALKATKAVDKMTKKVKKAAPKSITAPAIKAPKLTTPEKPKNARLQYIERMQAKDRWQSAVKFEPVLNGVERVFKPLLNAKKGFFGSLWDDIKFGATVVGNLLGINQPSDFRTPGFNPNANAETPSIWGEYQPLNRTAVTHNESNQQSGIVVNFNPTIHVGENVGQGVMEQVQQGLNMSLVEFERLLNRVLDQRQRRAY